MASLPGPESGVVLSRVRPHHAGRPPDVQAIRWPLAAAEAAITAAGTRIRICEAALDLLDLLVRRL
jgi:hypothetical protein